jgi:hypothetical protein
MAAIGAIAHDHRDPSNLDDRNISVATNNPKAAGK